MASLLALRSMAHNCNQRQFIIQTFRQRTLSEAILSSADLTGSVFDNAVLTDAILLAANITDASFRDARFAGANLQTAIGVETANFDGACATEDTLLPSGLSLPDCAEF